MVSLIFRFLLFLVLLPAVCTGLAVLGGQAFGQAPPALRDIDACTLPCWNGIMPGDTEVSEAVRLLAQHYHIQEYAYGTITDEISFAPKNGEARCSGRFRYSQSRVTRLVLQDCGEVQVGDVVNAVGKIDGLWVDPINISLPWGLTFRSSSVRIIPVNSVDLTPRSRNFYIALNPRSHGGWLPWDGFMSRKHYCGRYIAACVRHM